MNDSAEQSEESFLHYEALCEERERILYNLSEASRFEDMSPRGKLIVYRQKDGDMIVVQ